MGKGQPVYGCPFFPKKALFLDFLNDEVGAPEVTEFVKVFGQCADFRVEGGFLVLVVKEAAEAELAVPPVADYIIIPCQDFAVSVLEGIFIETVPEVFNDFVGGVVDNYHSSHLICRQISFSIITDSHLITNRK